MVGNIRIKTVLIIVVDREGVADTLDGLGFPMNSHRRSSLMFLVGMTFVTQTTNQTCM